MEWLRHRAVDFTPSARQQLVMAAAERALASGLFYNDEINEAVASDLEVTPQQRARNSHGVEGGDFGFDVYFAQRAVTAIRERAKLADIAAVLQLQPGVKLGTLVFNDQRRSTSAVVRSAQEDGSHVLIDIKQDSKPRLFQCDALSLVNAVRTAHELGHRPDSYDQFKLARVRERAVPVTAVVGGHLAHDPRVGLDEVAILSELMRPSEMSQAVYLALQRRAESMGLAAAQGQDCLDGFDAEHAEVARLQDASPWTLHPDHGCVLAADVEALDLVCESVPH